MNASSARSDPGVRGVVAERFPLRDVLFVERLAVGAVLDVLLHVRDDLAIGVKRVDGSGGNAGANFCASHDDLPWWMPV